MTVENPRAYIRVTKDGNTVRWELMYQGAKIMEFTSRGELADFVAQASSSLRW